MAVHSGSLQCVDTHPKLDPWSNTHVVPRTLGHLYTSLPGEALVLWRVAVATAVGKIARLREQMVQVATALVVVRDIGERRLLLPVGSAAHGHDRSNGALRVHCDIRAFMLGAASGTIHWPHTVEMMGKH
jgi:hypothetical protein